MFKRVLVANRGEIACRIIRTLRRMGIESVVIASIPDRQSLAVRTADDWVLLEGESAAESYLDQDAVIAAAKARRCEAIHPGYGFLAENPAFAARCEAEGVTFIGPTAEALEQLGNKATARSIAADAGVPVVPGYDGPDDDDTLEAEAERIGFPLVVKARAGGGGRGMRVVREPASFREAVDGARREAASAFGDGSLLLEKLVEDAHHVEVQVIADARGAVIHLGERDCSVQRRHQKVIEEAPGPVVTGSLRDQLTSAAVRIARAAHYRNAGTFEFLVGAPGVDGQRPAWFIEANPRLQVEHPVTEAVTGLDLVELQVRVAAGEPLPLQQQDVELEGHAIEVRLYAEDPSRGFEPQTGRIHRLWLPDAFARVDAGYESGDAVPAHYDTLVAKVIAHAPTRAACVDATLEALGETGVDGLPVNLGLCRAIVASEAFGSGSATVEWLDAVVDELAVAPVVPVSFRAAAAGIAGLAGPWIGAGPRALWLSDGSGVEDCAVNRRGPREALVTVCGETLPVSVPAGADLAAPGVLRVFVGNDSEEVRVARDGDQFDCEAGGRRYRLSLALPPPLPRQAAATFAGATVVTAPLSGTVAAVYVAEGDEVEPGQLLLTLDAMKIEHRLVAPAPGTVKAINATEGQAVTRDAVLVEIG